jgi:phosphoserine phosphatase
MHNNIVITATNSFVTRPIAQVYGIDELLATEPEMIAGRFTGKVLGEPCFLLKALGRILNIYQYLTHL